LDIKIAFSGGGGGFMVAKLIIMSTLSILSYFPFNDKFVSVHHCIKLKQNSIKELIIPTKLQQKEVTFVD